MSDLTSPLFQAPLIVGRGREQATLRDHLAAASAGHGSLVLIGGEAGIGKTALAETLCREVTDRHAFVAVGRCYDLAETPPYGPWGELLRGLLPSANRPPALAAIVRNDGAEATNPAAIFATVREVFATAGGQSPLVVLLDDLQWADPASLDLLRFIGREIAALPILFIAIYRTDELAAEHHLALLLPTLVRESHATRLTLRPLEDDAVRALVQAQYALSDGETSRLVAYLQERAEGNPFFIGELTRALEDAGVLQATETGWVLGSVMGVRVPPLVQQVIAARLTRLGEDARELLAVAAVIGQEVPYGLWATISGADEATLLAAVERGRAAHALDEMPDAMGVRFAHALIRMTLYEGIAPSRRREWHRMAGETLAALPTPDPDAVAYHFRQGGDARTARWLIRAGERAQRTYAWITAAERFDAALVLLRRDGADATEQGWLLFRLAWLRQYTAMEQSILHLQEAERLAAAARDPLLSACAIVLRGHVHCSIKNVRQGVAEMEAGVTALDALAADAGAWCTAMTAIGVLNDEYTPRGMLIVWLAYTGRFADARALAERSVTTDPTHPAPDSDTCYGLALAYAGMGEPEAARRMFAHTRRVYRAIEHFILLGVTIMFELAVAVLPYQSDRPEERQRMAQEAEEAWKQVEGTASGSHLPRAAYLPLLVLDGRWGEVQQLAAVARAYADPLYRQFGVPALAALAYACGEWAALADLAHATLPEGAATEPGDALLHNAIALQRLCAAAAVETGDFRSARAWLEAHDRWLAASGAVLGKAENALGWAIYHRAVGEPLRAYRDATRALAQASAPRQPLALLAAHRLLGELATVAGRFATAAAHVDAALTLADTCAVPYERALTLLARAALHNAQGRRTECLALLDEVRAICEPLGARPALARADALAERITPAPWPPLVYPDGLTAREAEVLRLIARGTSNRAIAVTLSISVRTVERHITNLYTKIGARGKADATTYALHHHLD